MLNTQIRYPPALIGVLATVCLVAVTSAVAHEGSRPAGSLMGTTTAIAAEGVTLAQSRRAVSTTRKQTRDLEVIPSQLRRGVDSAISDLATRQGGTSSVGDLAGGRQPSAIVLLDMICGDSWFVSWLEDEDGNPIPGSHEVHCG